MPALTIPARTPPVTCCSHQAEVVRLAVGADASSLAAQAGHRGRIVLGKAGYMEKDEGVRRVHNWRIQGCVPAGTSEWAAVGQGGS